MGAGQLHNETDQAEKCDWPDWAFKGIKRQTSVKKWLDLEIKPVDV